MFSAICMHLNILILIKAAKKTQQTLFACYNAQNLTESDLKKAYFLLTERFFLERLI